MADTIPIQQAEGFFMLPAPRGTCPDCAHAHAADQPHNAQTLFYQVKFKLEHGRAPTWADALAHCSDAMKTVWRNELIARGVDVDSGQISPRKAHG